MVVANNSEMQSRRDLLGSRDLVKFWVISDNLSETVQDRHIVAVED